MTVCKILIMLDSVSGPKPVCLQQVTVHLDLESLIKTSSSIKRLLGEDEIFSVVESKAGYTYWPFKFQQR